MEYVVLLLNGLLFGIQTVCWKIFSKRYLKNRASFFLFNTLYFTLSVIIFGVVFGLHYKFDLSTLILGTIFGLLFVITTLLYIKSMESGPLSYSSLLFSFGIIIPVFVGIVFWGEKISVFRVLGFVMLLSVIVFSAKHETSDWSRQINFKWIMMATLSFLGNGFLMVIMKVHQRISPGQNIKEFLVLSFATAALLSFIGYLYSVNRNHETTNHFRGISPVVLGAGITTAFGNILAIYLSTKIPAIVQFPSVCLLTIVVSSLFSRVFLMEKLDLNKVCIIASGIVALFIINL